MRFEYVFPKLLAGVIPANKWPDKNPGSTRRPCMQNREFGKVCLGNSEKFVFVRAALCSEKFGEVLFSFWALLGLPWVPCLEKFGVMFSTFAGCFFWIWPMNGFWASVQVWRWPNLGFGWGLHGYH